MARIAGTEREPASYIKVDGEQVPFHPGETIATAMLAAGHTGFRHDRHGRPRGLWCNMGTCSECLVHLHPPGDGSRRVRACLVDAEAGQRIDTAGTIGD